jgi:hypothetical protein
MVPSASGLGETLNPKIPGVDVAVEVMVLVAVGVLVGRVPVTVGVLVGVWVGRVPVGVWVGVFVIVGVRVMVGVRVGVWVGMVPVGVGVDVLVNVDVRVGFKIIDGVRVCAGIGGMAVGADWAFRKPGASRSRSRNFFKLASFFNVRLIY